MPRFLRSFDETLDGDLILPRGLADTVSSLIQQAGSRIETIDERASGSPHAFTFTATLTRDQRQAVQAIVSHDQRRPGRTGRIGQDHHRLRRDRLAQTSTLVLVDRNTLADQVRSALR